MSVDSELWEDESFDVRLGDGPVDVGENESGRLVEKKDRERNLDVNGVDYEKTFVVSGLQI